MNSEKFEVTLKWSDVYSLKDFDNDNELHQKMSKPGIYVNIVSMYGFNRITYVGESYNIHNRWRIDRNNYYDAYHGKKATPGHTMYLSRMIGDPYDYLTDQKGMTIEKLEEDEIYFPTVDNCTEEFLSIRRAYFVAFVTDVN